MFEKHTVLSFQHLLSKKEPVPLIPIFVSLQCFISLTKSTLLYPTRSIDSEIFERDDTISLRLFRANRLESLESIGHYLLHTTLQLLVFYGICWRQIWKWKGKEPGGG
ncbi:hypothetical protein EYC80_007784 [Monilinia laxa]|uniref:Uncharacterized protein n=1 Tax=Monilinia laxa TaxID=61186 RepID=A0A5N6JWZ9_MONLA|nr:hypothetical protein EYC80_007784 [Monilinia laxa]